MAMCMHMRFVKMAVQSFHLVDQECRLVGHWPMAGCYFMLWEDITMIKRLYSW